jgi:hypothetical protein
MDSWTKQETVMKPYRWLTLSAAIVITMLEAWLFTGASANASQIDAPTSVVMITPISGDTP